jgi:hypothetical protein
MILDAIIEVIVVILVIQCLQPPKEIKSGCENTTIDRLSHILPVLEDYEDVLDLYLGDDNELYINYYVHHKSNFMIVDTLSIKHDRMTIRIGRESITFRLRYG